MPTCYWLLVFLAAFIVLSYSRASLRVWTSCYGALLIVATLSIGLTLGITACWLLFLIAFIPLNLHNVRCQLLTRPILNFYRKVMPTMSRTEREAISAGTVTWEGDLFRGNPNWEKLLKLPSAKLTEEEQAFLDGPTEKLCKMLNDWDITQNRADLPPDVWEYIKEQGFFALIIPKQYGGKEFSAYAHSQILIKISSRCVTAACVIAVPNSLGPAELLLHYGTDAQKQYYLPRLAKGEEVPCFALTSPDAGSDAGSMTDHGIVCWGKHDGKKVLGIRLNFNKRYITLAPVATVIGLAFKLYDPEHLLGTKEDMGITCALIPRDTAGIQIGRRHFPLNTPFQNGPIHGENVFIPLDWIIGGSVKAGKGWRMLMECLSAGRAISLPSNSLGGAKTVVYSSGAYARIRKQFNVPIGRFEGVEEPLARMGAYVYLMDATRTLAIAAIDAGEKPAIASAIAKYHVTEMSRKVECDGMDIHGGKGICLGPRNYIARGYEAAPIAITVEGANILTRNMIIFGQGAMRCHPYVFAEFEAARLADEKESLAAFDKAIFQHAGYSISNVVRSLVLGLTGGYFVRAPQGKLRRYYQQATRFSSAFALITDVSMFTFGGSLKRKESISARLGDILSYLYLLSATLKHYHDQGENTDDLPVVRYACLHCLYQIQDSFLEIFRNFPNPIIAWCLRLFIFPLGMHFRRPNDRLNHKIAQLLMAPTETRQRLSAGAFLSSVKENCLADLQDALIKAIEAEPIEKTIKAAKKEGKISGWSIIDQAQAAYKEKIITKQELSHFLAAEEARKKVVAVDDFTTNDLARIR